MKISEKIQNVLNIELAQWKYLGDLFLEHGGIVVCDPLSDYQSRNRVQRSVPANVYPVYVLEVKHPTMGYRFAYAQIILAESDLKKVIHARFGLQNAFFVDSGLACFMDIFSCNKYISFVNDFYTQNPNGNLYDDLLAKYFDANISQKTQRGDWVNFTIPGTPNNIIMFQSGLGDGLYKAYWGMGKGNKPCRLVIDFDIERFN